jgi:hypothetical protein
MEVEFNPGLTVNHPVSQSKIRREPTPPADNPMSFDRTQALEQTLKDTPKVRPESVVRAAALLSDVNYPSDEVINRVAGVLVQNINNQQT